MVVALFRDSWRPREVRLHESGTVQYWKKEKVGETRQGCFSVMEAILETKAIEGKQFGLEITTKDGVMQFAADTSDDVTKWVSRITAVREGTLKAEQEAEERRELELEALLTAGIMTKPPENEEEKEVVKLTEEVAISEVEVEVEVGFDDIVHST